MVTRTYEVRTYGCQMNVHDSERIAGWLDEAGYPPVTDRRPRRRSTTRRTATKSVRPGYRASLHPVAEGLTPTFRLPPPPGVGHKVRRLL
ncbi:MAG TPA: hypothetical protein VFH02_06620 [Jiangellaceae bacterium]|nr:hypothetical protein [Jiangellaceae bacterium]